MTVDSLSSFVGSTVYIFKYIPHARTRGPLRRTHGSGGPQARRGGSVGWTRTIHAISAVDLRGRTFKIDSFISVGLRRPFGTIRDSERVQMRMIEETVAIDAFVDVPENRQRDWSVNTAAMSILP